MRDTSSDFVFLLALMGGMGTIVMVVLWIGGAILIACAAQDRERDILGWGLIALLFSPVVSGIALTAAGDHPKIRKRHEDLLRQVARGVAATTTESSHPAQELAADTAPVRKAPSSRSGLTPVDKDGNPKMEPKF